MDGKKKAEKTCWKDGIINPGHLVSRIVNLFYRQEKREEETHGEGKQP